MLSSVSPQATKTTVVCVAEAHPSDKLDFAIRKNGPRASAFVTCRSFAVKSAARFCWV